VVSFVEFFEYEFNLNISRYVQTLDQEKKIDVRTEIKELSDLRARRDTAEARMMSFLQELGYVE
jgi:type I restriction enzyme M protein